jgi:hypothetical protein
VPLSGIQIDAYDAPLLYSIGSEARKIALRGLADKRGWQLNE